MSYQISDEAQEAYALLGERQSVIGCSIFGYCVPLNRLFAVIDTRYRLSRYNAGKQARQCFQREEALALRVQRRGQSETCWRERQQVDVATRHRASRWKVFDGSTQVLAGVAPPRPAVLALSAPPLRASEFQWVRAETLSPSVGGKPNDPKVAGGARGTSVPNHHPPKAGRPSQQAVASSRCRRLQG